MTTHDTPEAALAAAGFSPHENVCASCKHPGGDHDLGNWCLICPRPDVPIRSVGARLAAGWCYFASMTEAEQWAYGLAALDGWTLVPVWHFDQDDELLTEAIRSRAEIARLRDAPLDVRRVVKAIENVATRHGLKKEPPAPLARIYGYSTTPDDMDEQIAAEYARLAPHEASEPCPAA
jgi:hypothetical protein